MGKKQAGSSQYRHNSGINRLGILDGDVCHAPQPTFSLSEKKRVFLDKYLTAGHGSTQWGTGALRGRDLAHVAMVMPATYSPSDWPKN